MNTAPHRAQPARKSIDEGAPSFLGLSTHELRRWNLKQVLQAIEADPLNMPGAEFARECSQQIGSNLGRMATPGYVFVPLEVMARDLTTASGGAGGYLVESATDTAGGFGAALRGALAAEALGVTRFGPLTGNLAAPVVSTPPAYQWLQTEATPTPEAQHTFGSAAVSPKSVSSFFEFSRSLMLAAPPSVFEALVMGELARGLAAGADAAMIAGTGASGQPTGILRTAGVFSQSGTSLAYAGVANMIEAVEVAGLANPARGGFALGTGAAKLLRQRERAAGSGNILQGGQVDGFTAVPTRNAPADAIVFGDWSRVALCEYGILEIGADPFTKFTSAIIGARAIYSVDVLVIQPGAFAKAEAVT